MKTLRKVKPNPNDPTWTFPYATRKYVEKLRRYFLKEIIPAGQLWRSKANPVLPKKVSLAMRKRGIQWPSVPRRFRKQVNDWYIKKLNEWIAEHGSITRAKDQSLKMNAACYGRYVLTGKRLANRTN